MTLRLRLSIAAAALLAVISVLGVFLIHTVEVSELGQIDRQVATAVPVVGVARGAPDRPPFRRPFSRPEKSISSFYIAVVDNGHRTVVATPLGGSGQAPRTPTILSSANPRKLTIETVDSVDGSMQWRAVLLRSPDSHGEILIAASLARVDSTLERLRLSALLAGLVALAVLAAAGIWVGRYGLRPIAEVTEVADAISLGERSRRVTDARPGTEAAQLARAFNVMLDEQQTQEARLRQFIADASHELRTPISVIQGITGLWRQGDLRHGEALEDAMRRIGYSSAGMVRLVEDLLLLARLDEGQPLVRETVDLVPLVSDAVSDASVTAPARPIRVEADGPVEIEGDASALRQVVANLIGNSLAHTPPEASITVRVVRQGDRAVLEVSDSGPGMDTEHAASAFDRFWRGDSSRARPGTGLGLPIVAGIVTAHGGTVTLDSDPGLGTTVRVSLPVTS